MNWFAIAVIILQSGAGITYIAQGKAMHGALWLVYATSNVILAAIAMRP